MRSLFLVVALIAGAANFVAPSISRANPIKFSLKDATANFRVGPTVTFTGSFVFDPVTETVNNVEITVSDATNLLTVSPELFDQGSSRQSSDAPFNFFASTTNDRLIIAFLFPLGNTDDVTVPITGIGIAGGQTTECPIGFGGCASISVTGVVNQSFPELSSIPEPPALALLGAALGIFLVGRRAGGVPVRSRATRTPRQARLRADACTGCRGRS